MALKDDLATRVKDGRGASVLLTASEAVELLNLIEGNPRPKTLEMASADDEVGRALEALKGGGYNYPPEGNAGVIPTGGSPAVFQNDARGDALMEKVKKEREKSFEAQGMTKEGTVLPDQPVNLMGTSPTFGQPVDQPKGPKVDSSIAAARERAGMTEMKPPTVGKRSKAAASKTATKTATKAATKTATKEGDKK